MFPENKNKSGQALFELIIFMPFLVFGISMLVTTTDAINASINQQKATRSYFHFINKGNSFVPRMRTLQSLVGRANEMVGMASTGWRSKSEGDASFATCFKYTTLGSSSNETCDEVSTGNQRISEFVRIYTAFGVCGSTYVAGADGFYQLSFTGAGTSSSCEIK